MNMESQSIACPNPSCGKVFANPLKAQNMTMKNAKPYDACPYCLTEIPVTSISAAEEEPPGQEHKLPEIDREAHVAVEEKPEIPSKEQGCNHHFGYLSKRSSKEKIPEECMMCGNIVQCMLKTVTG
jgi:hypothetical protein